MNKENKFGSKQKSPLDLPAGRRGGDLEGPELGGLKNMNRKEFLKTVARYGLLALIVALGVFLMTNRETKVEEECNRNFECRGCGKRENCKIKASPNPSQRGAK
jgi:hypothetical protein